MWIDYANPMVFPALMTLSFMNCRNVERRLVVPPQGVAKKAAKRHRSRTRYYVLDIEPMRKLLDGKGEARTKGIGHALHICRGHFKTFTSDAPLFGRLTGTYWWTPQVRGRADQGTITKDYRIRVDGDGFVGSTYREADESVEVAEPMTKAGQPEPAPDEYGRGLRAHNRTQNVLAEAVRAAGYEPRSPRDDDPPFDLLWRAGDETWVAEVKSITEANEEGQLRMALGQVKRYAQALEDAGTRPRQVVAVECHPFDDTWIDLFNDEGIVLVWPEVMQLALG
jgi:hypothetical protein